jgi:prevent-host-death family protein
LVIFSGQAVSDTISTAEAKARFSELIDRAAAGEEIIVTRSGKPRARIVPLADPPKRKFGMMRGKWPKELADLTFEPATEEDVRWAEGYYQSNGLYYTKADLKRAWKATAAVEKREKPSPKKLRAR